MKTALKILALVVVLCAGAVYFFLKSLGPTDPARLAPAGAVAFHSIPDGIRSSRRWQNSALFKISQDPAVKEFLQKPFARLDSMGVGEAREILDALKPARFFSVVIEPEPSRFSWYGGFQFFGGDAALDRALDRLRTHLGGAYGTGSQKIDSEYEGIKIVRTDHGSYSLFSASHGRWCFLSTNEASLHQALDRATGRTKSPSLADSADFQLALKELPKDPDLIGFIRLEPVVDALLLAGQATGAQVIPEQVEQLRRAKSIAFGGRLEGPNFRDVIFVQGDIPTSDGSALEHDGIQFAPAQSALYLATILHWERAQSAWAASPVAPYISHRLSSLGLSEDDLPKALEPEVNMSASWPSESLRPELLFAIPLRDAAIVKKWLNTLVATRPDVDQSEDAHGTYYLLPSTNPLIRPALGIGKDFLLAGLGETEVRRAAAAQGGESLANSATFQSVKAIYEQPNDMFVYLDSALLFDRAYAQFQPVIAFGAALMPGVSDYIDVSKLPPASAVSSQLTPMTFSARKVNGGYLMESQGPITFHQAALLGGASTLFRKIFPR